MKIEIESYPTLRVMHAVHPSEVMASDSEPDDTEPIPVAELAVLLAVDASAGGRQ